MYVQVVIQQILYKIEFGLLFQQVLKKIYSSISRLFLKKRESLEMNNMASIIATWEDISVKNKGIFAVQDSSDALQEGRETNPEGAIKVGTCGTFPL